MPFAYFLSYASVNRTKFMDRFTRELKQLVLEKTGQPPDSIDFFAPTEIKTGRQWQEELGGALRNSKTIVCLCTPHYFTSQYCGKEVSVFLLRRENFRHQPQNAERKAGVVFPVIWEWPVGGLHSAFKDFQYFDETAPRFPKTYVENGLNALIRLRREADFQATLIALASRIRDAILESDLPEWPNLPAFDLIESVFHMPAFAARYQYGLVFLHAQGTAWHPFAGPGLYELCDLVAAQTSRVCRPIIAAPGLIDILRHSETTREGVVIVTDLTTASGAGKAVLQELDSAKLPNCAVFVLADESGAGSQGPAIETLDTLRADLPNLFLQQLPHSWLAIRSAESLARALVDALVKIGADLVKADPAKKVDDQNLSLKAQQEGIQTQSAPVLTGPGRSE